MIQKLTLQQARENASMFFYIFAPEEFLNAIPEYYANVIRGKALNQKKVLLQSARTYIDKNATVNSDAYKQYTDAVHDGFKETYDMTPYDALVVLAQGGEVAGKNWSQGAFGVSGLGVTTFKGTDISVNTKNGYMMRNGSYLPVTRTIYANGLDDENGGEGSVYQLFYYDASTKRTYMSQYYKSVKKFYAECYSDEEGKRYSAGTGKEMTNKDAATIWQTVILSLQTFLDWIVSLFSGNANKDDMINEENTLPSQKADGFVYKSGMGEAGGILLLLAAGGMLLANSGKKGKSK